MTLHPGTQPRSDIPVSQSVPFHPGWQLQIKPSTTSWHSASFWHGLLLHSLMSERWKIQSFEMWVVGRSKDVISDRPCFVASSQIFDCLRNYISGPSESWWLLYGKIFIIIWSVVADFIKHYYAISYRLIIHRANDSFRLIVFVFSLISIWDCHSLHIISS